MDANTPSLSFIGIVDSTRDARWVYVSASVSDLLGFESHELTGRPSLDLSHPDEVESVAQHHQSILRENKAAVLIYLRLRHKDPHKGYITCATTCTAVGNHIIGGISAATSGSKAMHNASTAQEVIVISPSATHFEFRRWNDPTPSSSGPVSPVSIGTTPPLSAGAATSSSSISSPASARLRSTSDVRPSTPISRVRLALERQISRPPSPSEVRTALILDRFSIECTVLYISNDDLFSPQTVMGRSFFDFISRPDEVRVRTAMETIKGWGVNERGHPSDGGFGFNKFRIALRGKDSTRSAASSLAYYHWDEPSHCRVCSSDRQPEGTPTQQRYAGPPSASSQSPHPYNRDRRPLSSRSPTAPTSPAQGSPSRRPRLQIRAVSDQASGAGSRDRTPLSPGGEEMSVDAIFSPQSDGIIVIIRPALNPN